MITIGSQLFFLAMDASIEGFVKALGGGVGAVGGLRTNSIFCTLKSNRIKKKKECVAILDTNLKFIDFQHGTNKISLESFRSVAKFSSPKMHQLSCLARPCSTHWK